MFTRAFAEIFYQSPRSSPSGNFDSPVIARELWVRSPSPSYYGSQVALSTPEDCLPNVIARDSGIDRSDRANAKVDREVWSTVVACVPTLRGERW